MKITKLLSLIFSPQQIDLVVLCLRVLEISVFVFGFSPSFSFCSANSVFCGFCLFW